MEKKSNWQTDLEKLLVELGWGGMQWAEPESLPMTEIEKIENTLKREERICRQCMMGEIEDEEHFCYKVLV